MHIQDAYHGTLVACTVLSRILTDHSPLYDYKYCTISFRRNAEFYILIHKLYQRRIKVISSVASN